MIWTKLPSTTLPDWHCRQAAHFGVSAGMEPELIEQESFWFVGEVVWQLEGTEN
jgi:hypothetical protein